MLILTHIHINELLKAKYYIVFSLVADPLGFGRIVVDKFLEQFLYLIPVINIKQQTVTFSMRISWLRLYGNLILKAVAKEKSKKQRT